MPASLVAVGMPCKVMTGPDQNEGQTGISPSDRRPIAARSTRWAQSIAAALARSGVTPNQISVASIVFAMLGAVAMLTDTSVGLLAAAVAIQLRLLCNLFDGMVAVEGGRQTPLGALYNEFPDRIADSLLLVAAGYAAGWPAWGWSAALLAALTAYVRAFGAALGNGHDFRGPMAKQHRMALLTLACLLQAVPQSPPWVLGAALVVISIGAGLTCARRTLALAQALKRRAGVR
jgi:phosphatidylglycerophosphate synthase